MRAFASCLAASLALAGCVAPVQPVAPGPARTPPQRVVSLNLCTDELLLQLAAPEQIASVSHLGQQPAETPLWHQGRRHRANDGSLASTAALRPDLVLTMGGGGDRLRIAERLGILVMDLPYPQSLDDVSIAIRAVAQALGRREAGEALVRRIESVRGSAPAGRLDTIWIGGGGRTVRTTGLEAQWMRLAGLEQRSIVGERVELEELLARPPAILLRSDYRQGQYSQGQSWLVHPLARAARGGRTIATDGRRWTCMGPLMVQEVERLRGMTRG